MSSFTNTYIDAMLNWVAGTTQTPNAAPVYVGVWNGNPFSGGTEVTANIGAATRPLITWGNVSTGQVASSNNLVTITSSATNANTVNYIGLHANATIANATSLFGSAAVTTKTLGVGDSLTIPVANCTITMLGYPTGTFNNNYCVWPLLNWLTGTSNTPAITAGRFVSLWNGDPQSGGTDVTANLTNSTTRQTITFTNVTSNQTATSNIVVNCVTSATHGNTVNYISLHTNSLTTNTTDMLTSVAVTSKNITTGDTWVLPTSNVTLQIS